MLRQLFLLFLIQSALIKVNSLSNETDEELQKLNALEYSHETVRTISGANFTFTIMNTTYAVKELGIVGYYYSITFLGEQNHEVRRPLQNFTNQEPEYEGKLIMKGLEEKGTYFVCVFFINASSHLIGSSRFCHVVCASESCRLEELTGTVDNRQAYFLLPFVALILIVAVLYSCIREYVYRPRTIEALLGTLPEHHADNLRNIAGHADNRRRRRTQPALTDRLREGSVDTINYDHKIDEEYNIYHGLDNVSLDTVPE